MKVQTTEPAFQQTTQKILPHGITCRHNKIVLERLLCLFPHLGIYNGRDRPGDQLTLFLTPPPVGMLSFVDRVDDQVAYASGSPRSSRMLLTLTIGPSLGDLAIVLCISGWYTKGVQMFCYLDTRPPFVG